MPDGTDLIFVVDRDNEYVGSLFLSRLLTNDPDALVSSIMSTDVMPIPAITPSAQVVWEFENRDLLSAPVVDDDYRVVGRITVDDVVDVIRDEAEHSLMSAAGLDEEDDISEDNVEYINKTVEQMPEIGKLTKYAAGSGEAEGIEGEREHRPDRVNQ